MIENVDKIKCAFPALKLLDKAFEDEFYVTTDELLSRSQVQRLSQFRAVYVNIAKRIAPCLLYKELGAIVNRDHCTAIWYVKKYDDWMEYDASFRDFYNRIETKFEQLKKEQENGME